MGEPEIAIVLGTGLGNFYTRLENKITIPYREIPNIPKNHAMVMSHKGDLYFGTVNGAKVLCWGGRFHWYEGFESYCLTFIANVSAAVGCSTFLVTNASGGAVTDMEGAGCINVLTNHINMTGLNPLDSYYHTCFGNKDFEPFYDSELVQIALEEAKKIGIQAYSGAYSWEPGPAFETPLEVANCAKLGCIAFGMSTVPEILSAFTAKMRTICVAVITNLAAGYSKNELGVQEVIDNANLMASQVEDLFSAIVSRTAESPAKQEMPNVSMA